MKDRPALRMVESAIESGDLVESEPGIIVEGTAGNTGIGLSLAGACFGFRSVIVLAETQSKEKQDALRAAGAYVVPVPAVPYANPGNYVHVAQRLADSLKARGNRVLYANQWDNPANRAAHVSGTGPEIWQQTDGKIDAFSCAMGTGGTLSGVATYLREVSGGRVKVGLTDPPGAKLVKYYNEGRLEGEGSSITEGIGQVSCTFYIHFLSSLSRFFDAPCPDFLFTLVPSSSQGRVTGNMSANGFSPDFAFEISDQVALEALWMVHGDEGLALGGSSGTNIAGAMRVARELGPGHTIVTVLCDLGSRYAGKLYNVDFLKSKGLPVPSWLDPDPDAETRAFWEHCDGALAEAM